MRSFYPRLVGLPSPFWDSRLPRLEWAYAGLRTILRLSNHLRVSRPAAYLAILCAAPDYGQLTKTLAKGNARG